MQPFFTTVLGSGSGSVLGHTREEGFHGFGFAQAQGLAHRGRPGRQPGARYDVRLARRP